ncbi:helix-turn-helix domain-containing protein [Streptococcus hyointestinalis]|uniref:helix-turn-helix domain-containing protein n=1 Tax=Streptococcus hyointestinalis TaxID=1337 RepID=UPI003D0639E0
MNRLKELRQEKNAKQEDLAEVTGVSAMTISRWENGESNIKPEKAQQLADYFGVSVGYLIGLDSSQGGSLVALLEEIKEIKQYACMVAGFNQVFIPESEVISVIEKHIKSLKKGE